MASHQVRTALTALTIGASAHTLSCNNLIGLNKFEVTEEVAQMPGACTTHADCALENGASGYCEPTEHTCVTLLSEDCDAITGDPYAKDAVLIGSLFSTKGAQGATNLQRQQAAALAIEQVNAAGGVPSANGGPTRQLVLVSCDESTNLERATRHLVEDLKVPAIVGPNTSQDTLAASTMVTVPAGTLVITPTAVASSIADLNDKGLTWLMVPTDVQRAPLMISQVKALETALKAQRGRDVRLSVMFRGDALGEGTRASLNSLVLNGKSLGDALGKTIEIDSYDYKIADQKELITKHLKFQPDIVVLAGTAEAVTNIMLPLEMGWTATERPEYVLIDSIKVPELVSAAADEGLRRRLRGTGITPNRESVDVYNSFKVDYKVRYPDGNPSISGMGPTYDATLALAFAIATTAEELPTGASLAAGLRFLSGGTTQIPMGGQQVLAAFRKLSMGEHISSVGTFSPLEWDNNGAVVGGTIEMWCVGAQSGTPTYASSGLTYDIKTKKESGAFTACK
jgi:ABC-type branched-subunit amino acid transport system substrate-binding protein